MSRKKKKARTGTSKRNDVPTLDYILSSLVAQQTGATWGQCYQSAYRAFFAFQKLFFPSGTFHEGWIVFEDQNRIVLMEHGWLVRHVNNQQRIIDPTMVLGLSPQQQTHYFSGVRRSWTETDALENQLFPHVRFSSYGEDGMMHPGYRAAYHDARRRAQSLLASSKELIEVRVADTSAKNAEELA